MTFALLPAVDVANARAVRLVQGEISTDATSGDPLAAALAWQADGAEWIHLVDRNMRPEELERIWAFAMRHGSSGRQ